MPGCQTRQPLFIPSGVFGAEGSQPPNRLAFKAPCDGSVEILAKVTDRSPRGAIFMSFAFPETTMTNVLTSDAYDFITKPPEFKACAARVEKLAAATGD